MAVKSAIATNLSNELTALDTHHAPADAKAATNAANLFHGVKPVGECSQILF